MKGTRKVFNEKTGKFEEGKARPWLPPSNLRELPEDYYTKDPSDPDKAHELDAPHVVASIVHDKQQAEKAVASDKDILKKYDLWNGPFNQEHIDLIKFSVIKKLVEQGMTKAQTGESFDLGEPRYLWFPKPRLDERELRVGRPPQRLLMPAHLRDKDLIVDPYSWPPRVVDMLRAKGVDVPDVRAMQAQLNPSIVTFN